MYNYFFFIVILPVETLMKIGNDQRNRREVFERYATGNQFDPLMAANWYAVSLHHLKQAKVFLFAIQSYFILTL